MTATRAVVGGLLLVIAVPAGAGQSLAMRVSPSFSYAPATLIVQLSIEPDAGNRVVRVVAESADFYRSSDLPLDGDHAARTSVVSYVGLPAGDYEVRSMLFSVSGRVRATAVQNMTVMGDGGQ
ncbi:MAG TPA: hypothetical protein VG871_16430 [Vicinamibacterales bacterium]|nr:hypothetical protein [Vicinamibacterales bacterium]